MGSLAAAAGHIAAFLLLFPTALRRLSSSVSLHLRCPPGCFRPRPWYFSDHPVISPHARLLLPRDADLHALLLLLPLAALSDFFLSPRLSLGRHSAALLLFWLLLLLPVYLRHRLDPSSLSLPDDLVFLLAALAFLADRALSSPSPSSAVEERAHELMGWLTLACTCACMTMAAGRASLAPDAALCMGLALKATWALQSALTLFALPPEGCKRGGGSGLALECELEEDRARAVALLDLLFVLHAAGIAAGCAAVYWVLARSAQRAAAAAEFEAAMTRPMMIAEFELD